jgi:hypothetical protein
MRQYKEFNYDNVWDMSEMYASVFVVRVWYVYLVGVLFISWLIGLKLLLKLKY